MIQYKFVLNAVGLIVCCVAVFILVPALADAMTSNPDWKAFAVSSLAIGSVGTLCVLATRGTVPKQFSLRTAFLLIGLAWLVLPLVSALPFLGIGISYADAVFEATSGITTTGSTVLSGLDTLPAGLLLWRALLQWIGGVGIVVMAIVMLPLLRVGGAQLFKIESSHTSDKIEAQSLVLVSKIIQVYVVLTALCAVAYRLFGMTPFDAICHAMATVSTGGYSTHDASFGYFADWRLHWAGSIFMLSGAIPFYLYIQTLHGRLRALVADSQVQALVGLLVFSSVLMAIWLASKEEDIGIFQALTLTTFNITSIVTTTGFASTDYTLWGPGAVGVFFVLMFVGGCSGSTSGAIKIYRFQVLITVISAHLKRLVSPNRVTVPTLNGKPLPADVPFSILAFLALFVTSIAVCTLVLCFLGLDLITAYSASVTAITNVGPGLGPLIGPAGNFELMPDAAKWLLCLAMLLGRLEIFTLLVMLDRDFWRG